jgi:release factor glutamine methyltransferase
LRRAAKALASVSDSPLLDAELLLAHALGESRAALLAARSQPCDESPFDELLQRRLNHEPVAYILGEWEFFGQPLKIRAPMLVPRPETEHLVEVALDHLKGREEAAVRVLDLCTGSGCVALALASQLPQAEITAVDILPAAVALAAENLARHGMRVQVLQGDLFAALPEGEASFDIIVSNPPYVPAGEWDSLARDIRDYEAPNALLSGADGLDCIRRIVAEAPRWLTPGGLLALEMAEHHGEALRDVLQSRGYSKVTITKDLAGHDRIASGVWGA